MVASSVMLEFVSQVSNVAQIAQSIHVLSLNRRKHEMCEIVSQCLRKLDHYGHRTSNQNKAYLSLSSVRYFLIFFVNICSR